MQYAVLSVLVFKRRFMVLPVNWLSIEPASRLMSLVPSFMRVFMMVLPENTLSYTLLSKMAEDSTSSILLPLMVFPAVASVRVITACGGLTERSVNVSAPVGITHFVESPATAAS